MSLRNSTTDRFAAKYRYVTRGNEADEHLLSIHTHTGNAATPPRGGSRARSAGQRRHRCVNRRVARPPLPQWCKRQGGARRTPACGHCVDAHVGVAAAREGRVRGVYRDGGPQTVQTFAVPRCADGTSVFATLNRIENKRVQKHSHKQTNKKYFKKNYKTPKPYPFSVQQ